jgi:hypothetical protein
MEVVGGIRQLNLDPVEVAGSSPVVPTILLSCVYADFRGFTDPFLTAQNCLTTFLLHSSFGVDAPSDERAILPYEVCRGYAHQIIVFLIFGNEANEFCGQK